MLKSASYQPAIAYLDLPTGASGDNPFFDLVEPASFPEAQVRFRNNKWAEKVGLASLSEAEWINHFGRFEPLPGTFPRPVAIRYHGHQFRHYNPDIGDGRGFLFGQVRDDQGRLLDLGTKGSGQTPYSRSGDGRLTLKGGVREILASQMLEALGVYTSKTLSIIETGEALHRNDEPSPARSCVMVRLSHSHVRFGVFQRLAYEKNSVALSALVDYCIAHFYPALARLDGPDRVVALYDAIIDQTARLTAQWMAAGFVHGVLNTDNMTVTGESFDYGPWRFLPTVDPGFTAAYFDQTGLYAYGRQGEATGWNLAQLGGTLTLLADPAALTEPLKQFPDRYERHMTQAFAARLGINGFESETIYDEPVAMALLRWMTASQIPFEQFFFDWFGGRASEARADASPVADHYREEGFAPLKALLLASPTAAPVHLDQPYFQQSTPCTMLIDEVESLWSAITDDDNWQPLEEKLSDIATMGEAYGLVNNQWPLVGA